MAKTFNQFKKKIDELYLPKAGDEAKFMAMHGPLLLLTLVVLRLTTTQFLMVQSFRKIIPN
jgi:hypothetical protein